MAWLDGHVSCLPGGAELFKITGVENKKTKAENQSDAADLNQQQRETRPRSLPKKIFILPIRLYQLTLSPLLGTHCRHTPSCSQYAIEAIAEWGPLKGMWLGMKRIARCHPWGTSGYDPVPKRES